ncbi:MAG: XRE family transcriptional regulator [Candidatus Hydrogenedentes bacterium]|nr:XRE family transcriptional regulator [Candidatus Hydrogenedentota bacterium]
METAKRKRLEAKGWKVGDAAEWLKLAPEEAAYIELKLSLCRALRERRIRKKLTQQDIARILGSSQSRVAKMEAGDPSVTLDLLVRSLLALGSPKKKLEHALLQV